VAEPDFASANHLAANGAVIRQNQRAISAIGAAGGRQGVKIAAPHSHLDVETDIEILHRMGE
jgi:hypothetical protein